jgi:LacI family transcriptional regulator
VTITDIARVSGVSPATVSLVLNNKPGVAQETRARVFETAETLGYPIKVTDPGQHSRSLATIGVIVRNDSETAPYENPFYSRILLGIEDACRRSQINLLFATVPTDKNNRPTQTPPLLYNEMVEGLLFVGTLLDKGILAARGRRIPPVILVDAYAVPDRYDGVVSDNFGAAYQAVEYLIRKGHRRIAMVGGEADTYPSLRDRRSGYLRAMRDHELDEVYCADFNINQSSGYAEVTHILNTQPQISALFCINDHIAATALRAAQAAGRQIPRDISLIGYDDISLSQNLSPALTTLRVDTAAMGRAAVNLLAFRLDNPDSARMTLTIHPTLIERASVGLYE